MTWAAIESARGTRHQLTDEDVLWAGRMVEGEGPVRETAAVLWTVTQRWVVRAERGRRESFTALMQGFSQPINPIWRRDGARCRPGGRSYGTDACSERRLARRDQIASMSWRQFAPAKRAIVEAWARGLLPNPVPRAANFAATGFFTPTTPVVRASGNTYTMEPESVSWPRSYVTVGGMGEATAIWPAAVAGAAIGGALLWAGWRLLR